MDQTATDIGSRLRQARERRGLTLRDIAATTKIPVTALAAIEHDDFARLPGGMYRRAYVRAFAAEVGLNADELARDNTGQTDDSDSREEVALAHVAVADGQTPSLRLEIRAKGPCWVSAVADGKRVVYRLMQPGQRTMVEARVAITLRVGDAGSFAYSINGATGRPLGGNGEAVTVRITNDNLGSLDAEPASRDSPKGVA